MMRSGLLLLAVLGLALPSVWGFGYITSRFRPEPGYGVWGNTNAYRNAFPQRVSSPREELLEALLGEAEAASCEGRRCSANEHCCNDHICMAITGRTGTCMATSSQRLDDECVSDVECAEGLSCDLGVCTDLGTKKNYGEDCNTSAECDGARGLCCQLIRRHRKAPRQVCSYYKDALICLGRVSSDQVKSAAPTR
ncbi:prohormone-3-like isoform X2 [Hyalella azteca]|uniref:Prohormone-3-like isoform X2 n=1 Tax=Hyalella azteca TaxID=294128 RepID=A0A8B7PFW2_HYAAZ|nr:prohormone-3-like isoform X2 [Hyalella azteca]XP_018024462.1 prohormone-3-like isoform X2 [Hyalella azteca]